MITNDIMINLPQSKIIELITQYPQNRIYISLPNIFIELAKALLLKRKQVDDIRVVVDMSEKNFRQGYGDIDAIKILKDYVNIYELKGNVVSFIICDDVGYFIFPQSRVFSFEDSGTNACRMHPATLMQMIPYFFRDTQMAIIEESRNNENICDKDKEKLEEGNNGKCPLIPFSPSNYEEVRKKLADNPPKHPDLLREIETYTSRIITPVIK